MRVTRRVSVTAGTLVALSVVAAIGWVDLASGPLIGFSLFYLMPIVHVGWRMGRTPAVIVGTGSALAWLVADLYWQQVNEWTISAWNGLTRLGIFLAIGILTARVRADQARTQQLLDDAERLARTDTLTGLANSRHFFELLRSRLACPEAAGLALAYMDVDNFKTVNDSEGHEKGDAVLRDIADRFAALVAPGDILARLGGDEFGLVMFGRSRTEVQDLVSRLVDAVEDVGRSNPGANLGLSVGVAHALAPVDLDSLVRTADELMYADKRARRSTQSHAT